MKHCSNCRYCVTDTDALLMGIRRRTKCRLTNQPIAYPFFYGFRCNKYRKRRVRW